MGHSLNKNCFSFRFEKRELLPVLASKNEVYDFEMDLLLLSDVTVHHYVLMLMLVSKVPGNQHRDRNMLCQNCLHVCSSLNSLRNHQSTCYNQSAAVINMPKDADKRLTFEKLGAREKLPYVVYFDFESLILPVQTVKNNQNSSSTTTVEQHFPCSFCVVVIEKTTRSRQ